MATRTRSTGQDPASSFNRWRRSTRACYRRGEQSLISGLHQVSTPDGEHCTPLKCCILASYRHRRNSGGWSQVASPKVGSKGHVIALDLLPILPIRRNVTILQGDFLSPSVQEQLSQAITTPPTKTRRSSPSFLVADNPPQPPPIDTSTIRVDTVLSDMMANMSGIRARDIEASLELCEMALHFSRGRLKSGLTKVAGHDAEGRRILALKDYKGNML